MARIYELKINNFRGIKNFTGNFNKELICLLGRGDSGKTTILEAIANLFSTNRDLRFYDNDFFNNETKNPISIEATILDPPEELLIEDRFGLYIRGLDEKGNVNDDLEDTHKTVLTIKMEVDKALEPKWCVFNNRQEPKQISAYDRAKFNIFQISDYIDRYFYWGRGSPLYTIHRKYQSDEEESNITLIDSIREILNDLDQDSFQKFENTISDIEENIGDIGVVLKKLNTSIDFRDLYIKEGKATLHDENIPLRLKGKGTRRLISIAIQRILAKAGGIVLIDEVEQGLEPDRVKNLVRILKSNIDGQIFITTHSREVITELDAEDLLLIENSNGQTNAINLPSNDQDVIRACPEAFYAKKVIVCEGKTEIGICRAIDAYRRSGKAKDMSTCNCVYTCGEGSNFVKRAATLHDLKKKVCVFCDSDKDDDLNPSKEELKKMGIDIFDCESGKNIEQQIFEDLPWEGVKQVIKYVIKDKGGDESKVKDSIKEKYEGNFPDNFLEHNLKEMRIAMSKASISSKNGSWFKRIYHGESIGKIILEYLEQMETKKLKTLLENLSKWID